MRTIVATTLLAALLLGAFFAVRGAEPSAVQPRARDGVVHRTAEHPEPDAPAPAQVGSPVSGSGLDREAARRSVVPESIPESTSAPRERGLALSGYAYDDRGTPLYFVEVGAGVFGPELVQGAIEPDGRFRVTGFEPGSTTVQFSAPGHVVSEHELELPRAGDLRVTLPRLGRLAGQVLDDRGLPAEGARLTVIPSEAPFGSRRPAAVTGSAGQFDFEAPLGRFGVRVSFEGAPPQADLKFELSPGQRVEGLVIRLRSGGAIEGFVHPRAGTGPVARAPVSVEGAGPRKQLFTDTDGRFRVEGLAAGHYSLSVGPTAAERLAIFGDEPTSVASLPSRRASAEVVEGATTRVEIGAPGERLTVVRGVVILNGEPMSGEHAPGEAGGSEAERLRARRFPIKGRVSAQRVEPARPGDSWQSKLLKLDSQGRFVLAASPGAWQFELRPPREFDVRGEMYGGGLVITRVVEIPARPSFELTLKIETGSISGNVSSTAGDPLSDIRVTLTGGDEAQQVRHLVRADVRGDYQFGGVPAGRYTLRTQEFPVLRRFGGPSVIDESLEQVWVRPRTETQHVDFRLRPGGGVRLECRAQHADLDEVVLRLSNGSMSVDCTYSADQQQFIATGLEPGRFEVTVARGPHQLAAPLWVDVTPGAWALELLELEPRRSR